MKALIFLMAIAQAEQIPQGLTKKDMPRFNELVENCMVSPGGNRSPALKIVQCKLKAHDAILVTKGKK